jgi:dTDP-4-dehydrorhamnose 3,5-epimerase
MLEGVVLRDLQVHRDDRGWLFEGLREDSPEFTRFGQVNLTMTYPGVIKAFHYHHRQSDHWTCLKGNLEVVLFDLRKMEEKFWIGIETGQMPTTPTHEWQELQRSERLRTVYLSGERPQLLTIPPMVAHGYRVLGKEEALLMYHVTHAYNPAFPDEGRIAWDDKVIRYDWTTKNR